jgi:hypothetical protein
VEPRRPIELTRPADPLPEADASAQRAASPPPAERPATTSPPPVERPATTSPPPVEHLATTSPPAPVARTRPAPAPEPEPEVVARAPEPDPEPVVKSSPTPPPAPETQAKAPPPPPEPAPSLPTTAKAEPLPGSPEISVQRTLWHPSASRRSAFVVLGGEPAQRVEEGDVVGRYVVQEIQPSRVVFLHDGKPLERKVGGP